MKLWMIVALEILLPGGTLVAAGLVLYQRRKYFLQQLSIRRPAVRLVR
jgi:hypothetical protein